MQVKNIMTANPACCTPDTSLTDVARMMQEHDCGAIPVCENNNSKKLVGVVTDRDIVLRTLADGKDPFELAAGDIMTPEVATVRADTDVEECAEIMKDHQVRRLFVTDENGNCVGIVAQADLALSDLDERTGSVVKEISEPAHA